MTNTRRNIARKSLLSKWWSNFSDERMIWLALVVGVIVGAML